MTHRPDSVFPLAPPSEAPRTAADLFVDCLENEGVEFVFGIPGEETLDISEALDRSQLITFVPTRHEQGAAFMADAYGRLTGRPGVCLATLGPGASNLATGVGDATLDHAPLVALTGQTGLAGMHKETTHQFIDTVEMLRPMTKWNTRIHHPRMVAGGGAQGVQHRRRREARGDPPGAARGHHGHGRDRLAAAAAAPRR